MLVPKGSRGGSGSKEETQEEHRWISVKEKEKILLLSGSAEDEKVLNELLRYKGYGLQAVVADGKTNVPLDFSNFASIVLNNVANCELPHEFLPALKAFVEAGGGLLLIGGDKSYGLGGYINTPLEEIAPADLCCGALA